MDVVLVVAMDLDGVIGDRGGLPWHLPADLAHFKAVTMGRPMIMGRKTCASLKQALPGRRNIVLTRDPSFARAGFEIARDVPAALALVQGAAEVMVIGGADVFAAFLPKATRLHLTIVQARVGGDTRFPPWDRAAWNEVSRRDRAPDEKNVYALSFLELVRPAG